MDSKKIFTVRIMTLAMSLLSLGLIGWGAYLIHPPAAPLVIGALIWIDLQRGIKT